MSVTALVFDLDGTLVDSADGILMSLGSAFATMDLKPVRPLTKDIIGPPLRPTLEWLLGDDDCQKLDQLAEAFSAFYDSTGFRNTRAFSGVETLLATLTSAGLPLWIATNKRKTPTSQIIDMLGWSRYFQAVRSLDSTFPVASSKGVLLRQLLNEFNLSPSTTLYVGDRDEDRVASAQAEMPFFHATWGYGDSKTDNAGNIGLLLRSLRLPVSRDFS